MSVLYLPSYNFFICIKKRLSFFLKSQSATYIRISTDGPNQFISNLLLFSPPLDPFWDPPLSALLQVMDKKCRSILLFGNNSFDERLIGAINWPKWRNQPTLQHTMAWCVHIYMAPSFVSLNFTIGAYKNRLFKWVNCTICLIYQCFIGEHLVEHSCRTKVTLVRN